MEPSLGKVGRGKGTPILGGHAGTGGEDAWRVLEAFVPADPRPKIVCRLVTLHSYCRSGMIAGFGSGLRDTHIGRGSGPRQKGSRLRGYSFIRPPATSFIPPRAIGGIRRWHWKQST